MKKFLCWWLGHDYTCAASEGKNPTPAQIATGAAGFMDYARMYCKRCNHVYNPRAYR